MTVSRTIVLLTDFGLTDPYVGVMKGVLHSRAPKARIIDLSHGIQPQNIVQAAHILSSSYRYFPKGSIFVCVVDPGVGTSRKIIAAKTKDYFFLAPDNGLLEPTLKNSKSLKLRSVNNKELYLSTSPSNTFHGRDIFAPVAAKLSTSKNDNLFNRVGPVVRKLSPLAHKIIRQDKRNIRGHIVYFDHFGNAITNIDQNRLSKRMWNRSKVKISGKLLGNFENTYGNSKRRLIPLFNSFGWLELAIPNGSAKESTRLKVGDSVTVQMS